MTRRCPNESDVVLIIPEGTILLIIAEEIVLPIIIY
jgi:hypothetical protein